MISVSKLIQLAVKVEEMNTNHGWGFGGLAGDNYIFKDGSYMSIGKRSYQQTARSESNVIILK